jgi:hypothetical protein
VAIGFEFRVAVSTGGGRTEVGIGTGMGAGVELKISADVIMGAVESKTVGVLAVTGWAFDWVRSSSMRSHIASVIGVPAHSKSCTNRKCAWSGSSRETVSGLYVIVGVGMVRLLEGGSTTEVRAVWD